MNFGRKFFFTFLVIGCFNYESFKGYVLGVGVGGLLFRLGWELRWEFVCWGWVSMYWGRGRRLFFNWEVK